ncbi:PKD domain-containing protein [Marinobacter sp.]|uniref:PKD domain-containing protein n=1 Tax=Marinobacter sp. TaxID=50741 RepID=UPI002B26CB88|nr:PKD domain-containing protein [Marinobacter sp.]
MNHHNFIKPNRRHSSLPEHWAKSVIHIFLGCLLTLVLAACVGDGSSSSSNDDVEQSPGVAQKGPLKSGGSVSAERLADDGSLSGDIITTTTDNNGTISLPDSSWSGPSRMTVNGVFFDEFRGGFSDEVSGGSLDSTELHSALVLPSEANTNVNLFTHFVTARTLHLMDASRTFDQARDQARDELAAILGITSEPNSLNLLSVGGSAQQQEDSANLLLFSAATLAAGLSQAEIDAIATDFANDGEVNGSGQSAFDAIKQATVDTPDLFADARDNLQAMYGVTPPDNVSGQSPIWVPGAPALPVARFNTTGSLKVGESQLFDASGSTGDTLTYSWDFGDGNIDSGIHTQNTYASADSYTVVLTVTDKASRTDSTSLELTVTEPSVTPERPTASFNVEGYQLTGQELTLNAGSSLGADLNYVWSFDDGSGGYGPEVTRNYTAAGEYLVKLKVSDSANQTDETTQVLTIESSEDLVGQMVTASDGDVNHRFGYSLDIDGDTAVVGAWRADGNSSLAQGAAYVFARDDSGEWIEEAKLEADDGGFEFRFGHSVAISGDTIVVGEPHREGERPRNRYMVHGAAHVFVKSGGQWHLEEKLLPSNTSIEEVGFGMSVAIDGDHIVVGRPIANSYRVDGHVDGPYPGAVYVYQRVGGAWSKQAKLHPDGSSELQVVAERRRFGEMVALHGSTIVVGAPYSGPGSAYVFTGSGTNWSQQAKLMANDNDAVTGSYFGNELSIDGNTILAGLKGAQGTGAVYVFTRSGGNWSEQDILTISDGEIGDFFGGSVAIVGDTIMATTSPNSSRNEPAYVFTRSGGQWSEQDLRLNSGKMFDIHPNSSELAMSSGTTLIGVKHNDDQGAVYFYSTENLIHE